jgi:hypothetical protein
MLFQLDFTDQASSDLKQRARNPANAKRPKSAQKALGYLQTNPCLNTHKYTSLSGPKGEDIL